MAGSIVSPSGAFSTAAAPGQRPNPYRDSGPWGTIAIGNVTIPGVIMSIDGASRPEEWTIQKGISVSGAVTVWRGTQLAETIKVVTQLIDAADIDAWYEVAAVLRPKIGSKPPALVIANPTINFSGITQIACRYVNPPVYNRSDGSWSGELAMVEYRPPKPVAAGTVEPPKPTAEDPANVKAQAEFDRLLDKASKL